MSDNNLFIWPADPWFLPGSEEADRALTAFKTIVPAADTVEARRSETIEFVDCGANFSSAECPLCAADLTQSWGELMNSVYATGFADLDVNVPCCGGRVSLNDLRYDLPMGFAKFVLFARNPGIADFPEEQMHLLGNILATPLRKTWQHL